jgi:hypothetical protein
MFSVMGPWWLHKDHLGELLEKKSRGREKEKIKFWDPNPRRSDSLFLG